MKKVLAMMLATATVMSVGVTAFADVNSEVELSDIISSSDVSNEVLPEGDEVIPEDEIVTDEEILEDVEPAKPFDGIDGFVIGGDVDNGVNLKNDILEPGTEYKFPFSVTLAGTDTAITEAMMKDHKFSYSKISTKGMKRFEVEEYKGQYFLYVETSDTTSTKLTDVKYKVKLLPKTGYVALHEEEVKFQYGYDEMEGDYITGLDKGDNVEIDNSRPVITTSQFEKIAKINEYKNVTLSGNSWEFNVNLTGETTKNLVHNNAGVKEILSKFQDQDFKFYNFPGKPAFSATGRLSLDVDDIVDDFEKMYTYRYADGKLYRMNATFSGDDNTLTFRTNRLDTFVVTDKLIKDGTVVNVVDNDNSNSNGGSSDSENDGKDNPTTGANDMINIAVMAAIAALGTAGALTVKKLSK